MPKKATTTKLKTLQLPDKQPALRLKPMPNDANALGDIFGGWLMSQIDIAGWVAAAPYADGIVSTVAVKELVFLKPIFVYDLVSFYSEINRIGNTSITVDIEVYAQRFKNPNEIVKVSNATLVYVAIKKPGVKRKVIKKSLHAQKIL